MPGRSEDVDAIATAVGLPSSAYPVNTYVVSHQDGLMLGARTFPGNPYDGHILSAVLEQAAKLLDLTELEHGTLSAPIEY